jgi:hypothetical protein
MKVAGSGLKPACFFALVDAFGAIITTHSLSTKNEREVHDAQAVRRHRLRRGVGNLQAPPPSRCECPRVHGRLSGTLGGPDAGRGDRQLQRPGQPELLAHRVRVSRKELAEQDLDARRRSPSVESRLAFRSRHDWARHRQRQGIDEQRTAELTPKNLSRPALYGFLLRDV